MNMLDYLEWRGDLSFTTDPFNEVDALIFSWLSYYPAEKLTLYEDKMRSLTIRSLYEIHREQVGEIRDINVKLNINPTDSAVFLLKKAAESPRYADVRILRFQAIFSQTDNTQFAAFSYEYLPGQAVIAYRGTDGTVTGWREDFMMCCSDSIPSQHLAREYLEAEIPAQHESILLCGHSKGGNIAMHAMLYTDAATRAQVKKVYNFDGPGFPVPMTSIECYNEVCDRIETILPESSIIGMLLQHEEDYTIIESEMVSMLQHNAFLWSIKGKTFVRRNHFSESSKFIDKALHSWLDSLTNAQKIDFINVTFDALEKAGIKDFTDLGPTDIPKLFSLMGSMMTMDSESRKNLFRVIIAVLQASGSTVVSGIKDMNILSSMSQEVSDAAGAFTKAVDEGVSKLKRLFRPSGNGKDT